MALTAVTVLNAGSGFSGSGFNSNRGYGLNHGRNQSGGYSLQQTERRLLLPQELMRHSTRATA